jgi:teichuronic acid biosynthesis glycosyltransferase TuaH
MSDNATAFLFLAANTRWVYALAETLASDVPVHATRMYDWRTYWMNRPSWPDPDPDVITNLQRTQKVLPTGYAGQLEWLVRPFMRGMVNRWREELQEQSGEEPVVVAPYPYLTPWIRDVPRDRLVYYNLDAYRLYRPERAEWIRKREEELVERAGLTICLAQSQVEVLRSRYPVQAHQIEHFPLGVLESFLNPYPDRDPDPGTVGYVGNLTDRIDWKLVRSVVEECSDLRFKFVGALDESKTERQKSKWQKYRATVLRQTNVEHLGRIPQDDVTELYWNCTVNWIPYDTDHPFNRAACPTKIMDGIASGRPVVSTDVPECRLYPEWITITDGPTDASIALRTAVRKSAKHDGKAQVAFARQHTWDDRADTLRSLVSDTGVTT